ncbi:MAG: hypothetical protein MJE77_14235 [Proteobacteria bacterium]|nr:hypothetical protein [Pseudomonadota bacterium]
MTLNVVVLVGGLAMWAYAQNLTVKGTTTGVGDATFQADVAVSGKVTARNIGSVGIRWGSQNAPANTTLLWNGWAWGSHYHGHYNPDLECIEPGNAQGTSTDQHDILYPASIQSIAGLAGITNNRHVACATYFVEAPQVVRMGRDTCPTGWTLLYSGEMMGNHYKHSSGNTRKCIDNTDFDASVADAGDTGPLFYPTRLEWAGNLTGYTLLVSMPCAVCAKL